MFQPRFALAAGVLLAASSLIAKGQEGTAPSLAAAAREAAKNFQAVSAQDVAQAKSRLVSAINQLDRYLRTRPRTTALGWREHLQWNDLVAITRSDAAASNELIAAVLEKFRGERQGLELKQFTRVRDALAEYGAIASAAGDTALKDEFNKRVAELAAQLETYAKNPADGDAALAIGRATGWLEDNRQAVQLVSAIRDTYGKRNLYGLASQRLLAAGIEDDIRQVRGVRDNILGTSLHGTAWMRGRTKVVLDENENAASLRVLLGGNIVTRNVGYNGPVTIQSSGYTGVSGQKRIFMTAEGLFSNRAGVGARTNSTIHGISANCGLIEKIAWKKAGQQKGQAEAIGSQKAAARVAGQMDRQAGQMIAEQNSRYQSKFRAPLRQRGEFPEEMNFSSQADRAELKVLQESSSLIAAPDGPPEFSAAHDLAVRTHESLVTNFGEGILGGQELTDLRLEKIIRDDLETELPEELRVTLPDGKLDPDKEPWSIIFAKELPVRAKFTGGGLWIAIRADGFTRGEGDEPGKYKPALTELVEISAQYSIAKTDQGATLKRDGDVQIRFPNRANPDQVTVRDSATVTFMRRKFRNMFKEEFVGQGITFKGRFAKAGTLRLQEIKSDNAWLSLGWQLPAGGNQATVAATAGESVQTVDGETEASLD